MLSQNNQTHSNALFVFLCDVFWTIPSLMANLVPCYAVAGHRGSLRCPGFVRRLVISCDIPRRGDLDGLYGFFRIRFWLFCKHVSTCPSQILHRRPQDSLPLLFLDLWFLGFLARNSQKGTPVFRPLGCI